jgi:hypothetical protein
VKVLLLAAALAAAQETPSTNQFQLAGFFLKDFAPQQINGQACVENQKVLFCGPVMEASQEDVLAWARFARRPERFFKDQGLFLGENRLAGIVFEPRVKRPTLVFYWKEGIDGNVYLRLPWPFTVEALGAWVKREGMPQWGYVAEQHTDLILDRSKRTAGQYTVESLKKYRAPASEKETLIVFTKRQGSTKPKETLDILNLLPATAAALRKQLDAADKENEAEIAQFQGHAELEDLRETGSTISKLRNELAEHPESYCETCPKAQ